MKTINKTQSTLFSKILCAGLLAAITVVSGTVNAAEAKVYYHNDILGSPIAATDENGVLCWREDYYPYGEKRLDEDQECGLPGQGNERGYTNHVLDRDIKLTYAQARYYDQTIGRFYGMDPVGVDLNQPATFNRYAYGNNRIKGTHTPQEIRINSSDSREFFTKSESELERPAPKLRFAQYLWYQAISIIKGTHTPLEIRITSSDSREFFIRSESELERSTPKLRFEQFL